MKKKILIVDDSLFIRKVLKSILSVKNEYEISEAGTGAKALEKLKKENPDMILLDIVMPEGDQEGLKVLEWLKESGQKTTVIMVTAVGQDIMIEKCKKLGAADFIVKPFDEKDIIRVVEKYI